MKDMTTHRPTIQPARAHHHVSALAGSTDKTAQTKVGEDSARPTLGSLRGIERRPARGLLGTTRLQMSVRGDAPTSNGSAFRSMGAEGVTSARRAPTAAVSLGGMPQRVVGAPAQSKNVVPRP